jgi:ribose/xylose/arabinose/galactoside ABC-type transport system permease subunit
MGLLLITLLIVLLTWANVAIVRMLRCRHARLRWWVALSVAWLAGAGFGAWSGFFFEYQPLPRLRVFGAPVPAVFFHWEGPPGQEQWIDFITPAPRLFATSNILILALLAACPIGLVLRLTRHRVAPPLG